MIDFCSNMDPAQKNVNLHLIELNLAQAESRTPSSLLFVIARNPSTYFSNQPKADELREQ